MPTTGYHRQRRRRSSLLTKLQIPHRPKALKPNTKPAHGQKKTKPYKKYGKKGNKRAQRQAANAAKKHQAQQELLEMSSPAETVDSGADGGPLIRLREAIVVDWNEGAYNALFEESNATWNSCEMLPDPELDKAQQFRARRKKNGISLEDCLDEFEREEVLSENDTWYCPRCKQHQRASKKFDLWKTPDILVVHLKRFSSSGWRREKLDILVDFPIEGLDLTKRVFQKESGKTEIYDLIGVDCHWGGLGGGHYTAHAKNFVDGQWYSYNGKSLEWSTSHQHFSHSWH
jgi:ubiquitin carboxyl-terminal hydrolase 4/11